MRSTRRFFCSIALFGLLLSAAHSAMAEDDRKDVVIGEQRTIFSRTLNENRTVFVSKPGDYDKSDARYAVLFVLDGRGPFYYTSAVARFMAASQSIPDLLIIGIDNDTHRARDLTPPATDPLTREQEPTGGGAAGFRSFIAEELMPWVDRNYRTRAYKILVGHSYGGLFVIDTLLTQPKLFNAYIAISPSLWWDNERLVERADAFFETRRELNGTLFLTAGNDAPNLRGSVKKFAGVLDEKSAAGLEWKLEILPLESHVSVGLPSTHQGLAFIFADWTVRNPLEAYNRYGIEGIERVYATGSAKYGYDRRAVPADVLRIVAQGLLGAGRLDELTELLARYRRPTPPRILEEIARGYRELGRTDRAIELYRQALKANPKSDVARKALTELGSDFSDLAP
jgi:predicted alpha/beta superfamily hydrolase